jgi:hypothetical protein
MSNSDLHTSNKKSAGKGNGNSVINNTEKPRNYVSGDSAPSSSKHKFGENPQNPSNKVK